MKHQQKRRLPTHYPRCSQQDTNTSLHTHQPYNPIHSTTVAQIRLGTQTSCMLRRRDFFAGHAHLLTHIHAHSCVGRWRWEQCAKNTLGLAAEHCFESIVKWTTSHHKDKQQQKTYKTPQQQTVVLICVLILSHAWIYTCACTLRHRAVRVCVLNKKCVEFEIGNRCFNYPLKLPVNGNRNRSSMLLILPLYITAAIVLLLLLLLLLSLLLFERM